MQIFNDMKFGESFQIFMEKINERYFVGIGQNSNFDNENE